MDGKEWIIGDRFSVTDIIVGYDIAWAQALELTGDFPNINAYADRLLARSACPYGAMKQAAA
jgi:glutathione S-transferase